MSIISRHVGFETDKMLRALVKLRSKEVQTELIKFWIKIKDIDIIMQSIETQKEIEESQPPF